MRLHVGPVPSDSARAWVAYAREKIDEIGSDPFETPLSDDLLAAFESYLVEWSAAAQRSAEFNWEIHVSSELAEYQAHAFHQIVSKLAEAAELRGEPLQPEEGEAFYKALVTAIIEGLMLEGESAAEYAMHLKNFWPGYGEAFDGSTNGV